MIRPVIDLEKYVDRFGAEFGRSYFVRGLTIHESHRRHAEWQAAKIKDLKIRIKQVEDRKRGLEKC